MNIDKALQDPSAVFSQPADIIKADDISRDDKVRLLRQWEYDAREQSVAEEENMTGGPPVRLDEVLAALHKLGEKTDHAADNKHGGE